MVYDNFATQNYLRSVQINETKINLDEYLLEEVELTFCEVCARSDREDELLLCDGCDKGYHMACLNPPLEEIPYGSWYCDNCFSSSDEESSDNEDVTLLNEDIEENEGGLAVTRLRVRQAHRQPIARTRQSERVRASVVETAASSQPMLREIGYTPPAARPSTSRASTSRTPAARPSTSRATATRPRKRRKKYRRRRPRTVVLEYDLEGDEKFAIKTRKIKRKIRKRMRRAMATKKETKASKKSLENCTNNFKGANSSVYGLQKERASVGLNFNIFEPSNCLEPYESDDGVEEFTDRATRAENVAVATRFVANMDLSQRRNFMIKQRVLANSSNAPINFLDSIMNAQEQWLAPTTNNFVLEKSGKLIFKNNSSVRGKQSAGSDNSSAGSSSGSSSSSAANSTASNSNNTARIESTSGAANTVSEGGSAQNNTNTSNNSNVEKPARMTSIFDDPEWPSPAQEPTEDPKEKSDDDECPNFSIYTSESLDFTKDSDSNSQQNPSKNLLYDEEDVDLVQLSDDDATLKDKIEIEKAGNDSKKEDENETEDIFAVLSKPESDEKEQDDPGDDEMSQIYGTQSVGSDMFAPIDDSFTQSELANTQSLNLPELTQNDQDQNKVENTETKPDDHESGESSKPYKIPKKASEDADGGDNRSYTPPITDNISKPQKSDEEKDRRGKKREMQRYNVRQRMRDKSPIKLRDQFGR